MPKLMKQTHAQRQEAAQLKKEEKARALKEKMMNEEDPEKQRRMDVSLWFCRRVIEIGGAKTFPLFEVW